LKKICYKQDQLKRNGTERNGTERNGTERNAFSKHIVTLFTVSNKKFFI